MQLKDAIYVAKRIFYLDEKCYNIKDPFIKIHMKTTCRIISIGALTLAAAGAVGLGILSQRNLLARFPVVPEGGKWNCVRKAPNNVYLICKLSQTYQEQRGELVCTVSGYNEKWCKMYSGKCVDYGWTTDNEDCTIGQLEPESPKFIPCAPGLAQ